MHVAASFAVANILQTEAPVSPLRSVCAWICLGDSVCCGVFVCGGAVLAICGPAQGLCVPHRPTGWGVLFAGMFLFWGWPVNVEEVRASSASDAASSDGGVLGIAIAGGGTFKAVPGGLGGSEVEDNCT